MAKIPAAMRISLSQARAMILRAQGLPPPGKPVLRAVLERTGFVRTLGGIDVYLALRARLPGLWRTKLDRAVDLREAQVVPSVRGCIYLVPRRDVALSLRTADLLSRARVEREGRKAGIRPGEADSVGTEVLKVLKARGPLPTDALRRAMPDGVVRSLGDTGKKAGISSPLPLALRALEFAGRIERTLVGGRLDTERYLWQIAPVNPFSEAGLPLDAESLWCRLAGIFFGAAGIGTLRDFATWAGIPQKDAKAAFAALPLVPVEVDGRDGPFFALEDRRKAPADSGEAAEAIAFLPFDDNLTALHDGPALLVDEEHHGLRVGQWGGSDTTLGASRHMSFRSFVADGKISGLWEYEPQARTIVLGWFAKPKPASRKRVAEAAESLAGFITSELGHGRSYSIDTEADLSRRAGEIRKLKLA